MLKEVSIVNILKQLRVLYAAVKQNKTEQEWRELYETYSLAAYSDFDSDADVENSSLEPFDYVSHGERSFSSVSLSQASHTPTLKSKPTHQKSKKFRSRKKSTRKKFDKTLVNFGYRQDSSDFDIGNSPGLRQKVTQKQDRKSMIKNGR